MLVPWMVVTPVLAEWAFMMEAGPDSTDSILLRRIQPLPQLSAQTASSSTNYTESSAGSPEETSHLRQVVYIIAHLRN